MKKSMINYISVITEEDYDILEDIISNKYKKFVTLYWILREFSSYIAMLQYKKSSPDTLNILIRFAGKDVNKIINGLSHNISNQGNVFINRFDDGLIQLIVEADESMPEIEPYVNE